VSGYFLAAGSLDTKSHFMPKMFYTVKATTSK